MWKDWKDGDRQKENGSKRFSGWELGLTCCSFGKGLVKHFWHIQGFIPFFNVLSSFVTHLSVSGQGLLKQFVPVWCPSLVEIGLISLNSRMQWVLGLGDLVSVPRLPWNPGRFSAGTLVRILNSWRDKCVARDGSVLSITSVSRFCPS